MTAIDLAHSEHLETAIRFQEHILDGVSRTFALTIPTLDDTLRVPVGNAYLLCRIADTIEDDSILDADTKQRFGELFLQVVGGTYCAERFAQELSGVLADSTLPAERELIVNCQQVVTVTRSLRVTQQQAMLRCLETMSRGMHHYQQRAGLDGLTGLSQLNEYCYFVAGVVGEMLTELFCEHSAEIAAKRTDLMRLAPSFGQGLQMTNILKDIWEDRQRGVCWLPRRSFGLEDNHTSDLIGSLSDETFRRGLSGLLAEAHHHLRNALRYVLLIPRHEAAIRRFCLWALGLAVLTLRKIHRQQDFTAGSHVKIKRSTVRQVVVICSWFSSSDRVLLSLFGLCSIGLPNRMTTPADVEDDFAKCSPETRSPGWKADRLRSISTNRPTK